MNDPARTLTAEDESFDRSRPPWVAVLALLDHPEPGRAGETVALDRGEIPIDRGSAVFPGGPLLAAFWRSLKDGNDRFERTHRIPKPTLGDKGYAFR
jgi:hypothetical protein